MDQSGKLVAVRRACLLFFLSFLKLSLMLHFNCKCSLIQVVAAFGSLFSTNVVYLSFRLRSN
jgi:hypothetical protein